MRFYADECFDGRIVAALLASGVEVALAAALAAGAPDADVLAAGNAANQVVLTEDIQESARAASLALAGASRPALHPRTNGPLPDHFRAALH